MIYKAGEQVGTLTTDKEGKARIENLYLGEYFVKEITPPVGYLADENEYDLVCSYEGDLVATVERDCTSPEQVKKQPFQIIKALPTKKDMRYPFRFHMELMWLERQLHLTIINQWMTLS